MAESGSVGQITVPYALRRYSLVATAVVLACMLAAGVLGAVRQTKYQATGSLVLQTPASSALRPTVVDQNRFVADQAAIMSTRVVSIRAAANLNEIFAGERSSDGLPLPVDPNDLSPDHIDAGLVVDTAESANLLEVRFTHENPVVAALAVNATFEAYSEIKREQALERVSQVRGELLLDTEIVEEELTQLQEELVRLRTESPAAVELSSQTQDLLATLEQLGERSLRDPSDVDIQNSLAGTLAQLQAIEVAQRIEANLPAVADLLGRIDAAVERRAEIQTDLLAIEREAEEAASDVALFSPAEVPAVPVTFSITRMLLIGAIVGLVPAVGISYALASRRPQIEDPYYPERLLGAPLLGIVPEFKLESVGPLPVLESRHTQAAEAFRFAESGIAVRSALSSEVWAITVTSAAAGEGKSVAAANLSLVMGVTRKVLCVDLDLEGQGLTSLLAGPEQQPGLSEVLAGTFTVDEVIQSVGPAHVDVDVLSAGLEPDNVRHALLRNHLDDILDRVKDRYEFIIIDLPALLNVAYGSSVVRHADLNLLVIAHKGDERRLAEMTARVQLLGAPVVGYLYNKAPLQEGRDLSVARVQPAIGPAKREIEAAVVEEPPKPARPHRSTRWRLGDASQSKLENIQETIDDMEPDHEPSEVEVVIEDEAAATVEEVEEDTGAAKEVVAEEEAGEEEAPAEDLEGVDLTEPELPTEPDKSANGSTKSTDKGTPASRPRSRRKPKSTQPPAIPKSDAPAS